MTQTITEWWTLAVHITNTAPLPVVAVILAHIVSWGGTQATKWVWPLSWHPETRHRLVQAMAFGYALATVYALIPTDIGIIIGIAVGVWSPVSWQIFVYLIGLKWPGLRELLSQDIRRGRRLK